MTISAQDVIDAYGVLLGRRPENTAAIEHHRKAASVMEMVRNIATSDEFIGRMRSPFFNYSSCFDAIATMQRHAVPELLPEPGFLINFLGVRIRESYLPQILAGKAGTVEDIPIPANWHADIAEWAAVLRAVDLAQNDFAVVELGCGWGCWLNNAGAAARRRGLIVRQIGVEGDEGHVRMAKDAAQINGFGDHYVVHHGLAAARSGSALFPCQAESGINWGLSPILNPSAEFTREALRAKTHVELPIISFAELTRDVAKVDLLHIDIQGGEADLIDEAIDFLNEKVAYLFVGSHSRELEGRITKSLLAASWTLEIDRPALFVLEPEGPRLIVDGAMGWRNPRLVSAG